MLGRCGQTTLRLIRRATRYNKRNAGSNPYAAFAGLKTSSLLEPSSSSRRTNLPPSPTFRNCLLPSTLQASESTLLWQISNALTEKGDVTRLIDVLTGPENPISTPKFFNALFARLRCLQDGIPPTLILKAMHCAANDPVAIKTLLSLYCGTVLHSSSDKEQANEPDCIPWFERFAEKILSVQGSFVEKRTKSQWTWVLAGWDGRFPKPPSGREYCLFDLGPRRHRRCWPIYVELLSMHCESELLANEWETFVTMENGTVESSPDLAAAQSFRENLNATVRALLRLGDPRRAWSIAHGAGGDLELMDRDNMRSLLAHPDGLKSWRPEMNEAALEMLDTEIQKIERLFGLRWEGGEEGFHRIDTASESEKLE